MAFLAGLGVAAFAVAGWRVPTQSTPGANLQVVAVGTNELVASSAKPFLITRNLRPGSFAHGAGGRVTLENTMAQPLAVRMRAIPDVGDLDRVLRVRATAAGRPLFRGTLGELRPWTQRHFLIGSHGRAALELQAWVPASARRGYQSRLAKVTVEFNLAPAGGRTVRPAKGRG